MLNLYTTGPSWTGANQHEHPQSDSLVQVAILDRQSDDEASNEHHVGLFHVGGAHFVRAQDPERGEKNHRE